MASFPKEEVQKRYEAIPESLKDFLFADSTAAFIESLGQKNGLLLDKTGALAEEVGYFVLGLVTPREFPVRLKNATGLADEKINDIIKELNASIFEPVRNDLMQLHNTEESGIAIPIQEKHAMSFSTTEQSQSLGTPQESPSIPSAPHFSQQTPPSPLQTPPVSRPSAPTIMNDPYLEPVE